MDSSQTEELSFYRTCVVCDQDERQVADVRERCTSCRASVCFECLQSYMEHTPLVLDVKCVRCDKSWKDREDILVAIRGMTISHDDLTRNESDTLTLCHAALEDMWTRRIKEHLLVAIRPRIDDYEKRIVLTNRRAHVKKVKESVEQLRAQSDFLTEKLEIFSSVSTDLFDADLVALYPEMLQNYTQLADSVVATKRYVDNMTNIASLMKDRLQTDYDERRRIDCASTECNGKVMITSDCRCTKCGTMYCKLCECAIVTDSTHVCDENVVQNVELVRKDSKPCPVCKVPIAKAFGCDDMYCTKCGCFFNWYVGSINDHRHNPEHQIIASKQQHDLHSHFHDDDCGQMIRTILTTSMTNADAEKLHNARSKDSNSLTFYSVNDIFAITTDFFMAYESYALKSTRHDETEELLRAYHDGTIAAASQQTLTDRQRSTYKLTRDMFGIFCKYHMMNCEDDSKIEECSVAERSTSASIERTRPVRVCADMDEFMREMLYEQKMLNEGERKYYKVVYTFVRCCNDLFRNLLERNYKLERIATTEDLLEYFKRPPSAVERFENVTDDSCKDETVKRITIEMRVVNEAAKPRNSSFLSTNPSVPEWYVTVEVRREMEILRRRTYEKFTELLNIFNDSVTSLALAYGINLIALRYVDNELKYVKIDGSVPPKLGCKEIAPLTSTEIIQQLIEKVSEWFRKDYGYAEGFYRTNGEIPSMSDSSTKPSYKNDAEAIDSILLRTRRRDDGEDNAGDDNAGDDNAGDDNAGDDDEILFEVVNARNNTLTVVYSNGTRSTTSRNVVDTHRDSRREEESYNRLVVREGESMGQAMSREVDEFMLDHHENVRDYADATGTSVPRETEEFFSRYNAHGGYP